MKNKFNSKHNHKNANPNNSKMKGYDFMKKTNKFAAFALAACMMAPMAMATTASFTASATDVTISSPSDKATHTYTAYKIFDGTYSTNGLTVTGWDTDFKSTELLADTDFTGIVIDSTTTPPTTIGSVIGSNTDAAAVAQAIEKIGDKSSEADKLASVLAKYVGTSGTKLSGTAVNLAAGYYIVKDTMTGDPHDAVSKFILEVSGGTTPIDIVTKKSYPTVEKKVKENVKAITGHATYEKSTTEKWNDVADYNIGDAVPFKLYGTMPSTLDDYEHYYYKFTDTLGSQFNTPAVDAITVKVNGTPITVDGKNCRVTASGGNITVSFEDIKAYSVNKDSIITVEYSAVLNKTAVIGRNGQTNKVDLEYSNNPNVSYKPNTSDDNEDTPDDKGKTPEDKVIVFTYELDVTKVDKATAAKLANAEFTLQNSDDKYAKIDSDGKLVAWVDATETDTDGTTTLKSGTDGMFKVIGIDDGVYTLTETKTPTDAYNAIAPLTLTIKAITSNTQDEDADGTELVSLNLSGTSLNYDATAADKYGIVKMDVANSKGSTLPSTGGIGTTIFYVLGGTLVVGSGIALVTKKRLGKNED